MNREPINRWLQSRISHARSVSLLGAVWSLVGGLLILLGTFVIAFVAIWIISMSFFHLSNWTCLALALGFLALVVVSGIMRPPKDMLPLSPPRPDLLQNTNIEDFVTFMTHFEPGAVYKTRAAASFGDSLFTGGVHMLRDALAEWRHRVRLQEVNTTHCAAAVAIMMADDRRIPMPELAGNLPGLNPVKLFDDLRYIEGVQILVNDPPGFALQSDFRSELLAALRNQR